MTGKNCPNCNTSSLRVIQRVDIFRLKTIWKWSCRKCGYEAATGIETRAKNPNGGLILD